MDHIKIYYILYGKNGTPDNKDLFISGISNPTSGNNIWPNGMKINNESSPSSPVLKIIAGRLFLFWRKMNGLTNRLYYSYTNDPLNSNAWSVGEEANLTDKPQTSVTISNYGDKRTLIAYENGGEIYVCQTTWKPFKQRQYVYILCLLLSSRPSTSILCFFCANCPIWFKSELCLCRLKQYWKLYSVYSFT